MEESRIGKAECLRAFAEVGTLKTETGFVAWLQLSEEKIMAYVHKPAPQPACAWLCSLYSRGLRLIALGPQVHGGVSASQVQNKSLLEQCKASGFHFYTSEYYICDQLYCN